MHSIVTASQRPGNEESRMGHGWASSGKRADIPLFSITKERNAARTPTLRTSEAHFVRARNALTRAGQGYAVPPGVKSTGTTGQGYESKPRIPAVPLRVCA